MKMFKNSSATKKQKMINMKNIFVVFVFFVAVKIIVTEAA